MDWIFDLINSTPGLKQEVIALAAASGLDATEIELQLLLKDD